MIAHYPNTKQTNYALRSTRSLAGLTLRQMSGTSGLGNTQAGTTQTATTPAPAAGTVPGTATGRFDWQQLVNQGLQFARDVITLRPAQGTIITQSPTGGIQVARGADGQPINYQAGNVQSQTVVGGNFGAGIAAQGNLGTPGSLLVLAGGALLLVLLVSRRG